MKKFSFRIWDIQKKEFYYNEYLTQYIRFDDIKGMPIYEGDIIKNNENGDIFEVNWDCELFVYIKDNIKNIEIIGTIYENSELLEK